MEKKNLNCQVKGCNGKLIMVVFDDGIRCECDKCGIIVYTLRALTKQTDRKYIEEDK